jgi:hypothetical protein
LTGIASSRIAVVMTSVKSAAEVAVPYIHETLVSETHVPNIPDDQGHTEIGYGPGIWTVAHRGYSGNRRLDVWRYRGEPAALKAAAQLALDCGLDRFPEAVERFKKRQYKWLIDRHNEQSHEWQILQVQVVNLIAESGGILLSSAEVRPGFS